jgi:hypothetical protein
VIAAEQRFRPTTAMGGKLPFGSLGMNGRGGGKRTFGHLPARG